MSEYKEPYVSDANDIWEFAEQDRGRSSPKQGLSSQAPSESSQLAGINDVSPELLALLSEKIKNEVLEALGKQTLADDKRPNIDQINPRSMQRNSSCHTSSTPSPPAHRERVYTPPSPAHSRTRKPFSPPPRRLSPTGATVNSPQGGTKTNRRESYGATGIDGEKSARPGRLNRTFSTAELTTIDQKWGQLFGQDKEPTVRLGQVLRGLANHIVEEFNPPRSIVITPQKMAEFYTRFPIDKEPHPFLKVFQADSPANLSRLYRDLHCEHHLISPHSPNMAPTIPALTPNGFANWITLFIVSYPELEHARLDKIVLGLPIDADGSLVDGKPERLPKQISRHLLPNSETEHRQLEVCEAMSHFLLQAGLGKPRRGDTTSGQLPADRTPHIISQSKPIDVPASRPIERERQPYVNHTAFDESAVQDAPPGVNIERERQPYTAMPGNGKVYVEEGQRTTVNSLTSRQDRAYHGAATTARSSRRDGEDDHVSTGRRESRAARDYIPSSRPRQTSPPVISNPARSSVPVIPSNPSLDRETKYGTSYSTSQNFNPQSHSSSGILGSDRDRGEMNDAPTRRERDRSDPRDRERERDRDRERDREVTFAREERKAGRPRRDTIDSQPRSDTSDKSGGGGTRYDRGESRDDYRYPRY